MTTPETGMPVSIEHRQQLAASWLIRLGREAGYDFDSTSLSFAPFIIGRQDGFHVQVMPGDADPWITAVASDPAEQERIDGLVRLCGEKVAVGDLGGHVWYATGLTAQPWDIGGLFFGDRLQEVLTIQDRFVGPARLGAHVLLNFREELPEGQVVENNPFVVHRTLIDVHVAVPGPSHGPLSNPIAHRIVDEVAAICTLFLGRPVDLAPGVFPAREESVAELDQQMTDPAIGTMTRHGVPLDIYNELFERGGQPSYDRARAAFLSYDAAVRQQREQVALILYVVAAECLTNPYQPWKTERLTTRFVKFFDELMPDVLDSIVQHDNFEDAFGIRRGSRSAGPLRRKFLNTLYSMRSEPVHEGLSATFQGIAGMGSPASQRRALASLFAQYAILRFLDSPRTALIGHPATAPEELDAPEEQDAADTQQPKRPRASGIAQLRRCLRNAFARGL